MRKIILAIIRIYLSPTMLNFSSSTLPSFHSAFWNAVALFSFDVCKCVNLFLKLCNSDWDLNPCGGFSGGTVVKNLLAGAGDIDLIPGQEDPLPGEGNGNPLQYSCPENSMDRGAWPTTVHGVTMRQIQLSGWACMHTCWDSTQSKPTVFQLRSCIWFQDLMKLRFLMSHCRKNLVRHKVIGKKWIYLERNTLQREYRPFQKKRVALTYGLLVFMGWLIL